MFEFVERWTHLRSPVKTSTHVDDDNDVGSGGRAGMIWCCCRCCCCHRSLLLLLAVTMKHSQLSFYQNWMFSLQKPGIIVCYVFLFKEWYTQLTWYQPMKIIAIITNVLSFSATSSRLSVNDKVVCKPLGKYINYAIYWHLSLFIYYLTISCVDIFLNFRKSLIR